MKKTLAVLSLVGLSSAFAQSQAMYPTVPFNEDYFASRIQTISEDSQAITSVYEISRQGLNSGRPANVPWSGSFWPLNQGMVASPYQDRTFIRPLQFLTWEGNVERFEKRKKNYLSKIDKMSEEDIGFLAPSEKYDLLLGDKTFDLSTRIFDYAAKWGGQKNNAFLSSIDLPGPQYEVQERSSMMALWEGICHGWASAAGNVPEPKHVVTVTLPDGRKLPFYPDDVKALISLEWANSMVQEHIIMEGNRCWSKSPDRDSNGRYIDTDKKNVPVAFQNTPGCGDIHPGMFHLTLANVMGKQKRSFVADVHPDAPIGNQPISGYRFKYYNPQTLEEGSLEQSVIAYSSLSKDPFRANRARNVSRIVVVKAFFEYADWYMPGLYDPEENLNKYKTLEYFYDLELDNGGNVIGGQWRLSKDGSGGSSKDYMPDFLWIIPKDYKKFFTAREIDPSWNIFSGYKAPESWKSAAKGAHSFIYEMTHQYGWNEKCTVVNKNNKRDVKIVDCEYKYPKPQPLFNIVDQLVEAAK